MTTSEPRVGVVGLGATGRQVVEQLLAQGVSVAVTDLASDRVTEVRKGRDRVTPLSGVGGERLAAVVLAVPRGSAAGPAAAWLGRGAHVISVADDPTEVESLLDLDALARERGCSVIAGAGFAPGLTGLLARHGANQLDDVTRVSVATTGTGGPACARQHHRALKRPGQEWWDDRWVWRRGGSGRELVWFPDPIGARDCYRGALADPLLIARGVPSAHRISARVSATRRDRSTARLPMLRPPHADGGPGAVRVEIRGRRAGAVETLVYGVCEHPSTAAATVATTLVEAAVRGAVPPGAFGTAELGKPIRFLRTIRSRGIRIETYESSR